MFLFKIFFHTGDKGADLYEFRHQRKGDEVNGEAEALRMAGVAIEIPKPALDSI